MLKAFKRLWRLGTCTHRNAMNWGVSFTTDNGAVEMHFCRGCGRLLMACRAEDQPQHNRHWLQVDHLDDKRYEMLPSDGELRALTLKYDAIR